MAKRPGPRDNSAPQPSGARAFFQVAQQRLEDARFLLEFSRNTAAVYLAGYAVECALKALLLATTPRSSAARTLESFRGSLAHNYDWLRARYHRQGGAPLPNEVARDFSRVNSWTTDLRYRPGAISAREAREFVGAAKSIVSWTGGRL